ncbi:hypothetical protein D3C72_2122530 [compost metagenome]
MLRKTSESDFRAVLLLFVLVLFLPFEAFADSFAFRLRSAAASAARRAASARLLSASISLLMISLIAALIRRSSFCFCVISFFTPRSVTMRSLNCPE